jgi:hypothetical protein
MLSTPPATQAVAAGYVSLGVAVDPHIGARLSGPATGLGELLPSLAARLCEGRDLPPGAPFAAQVHP